VIKSSVKINMAYIDKVIVICSGRIEGAHVKAIQRFMSWLSYEKYKQKFVLIYNKSDRDSEAEKVENIAYMVNELKGDPSAKTFMYFENGEVEEVKMNLAIGFPKGATYSNVERDHQRLLYATLAYLPKMRIPVDKKSSLCTIL
jgi:hypothetical protein